MNLEAEKIYKSFEPPLSQQVVRILGKSTNYDCYQSGLGNRTFYIGSEIHGTQEASEGLRGYLRRGMSQKESSIYFIEGASLMDPKLDYRGLKIIELFGFLSYLNDAQQILKFTSYDVEVSRVLENLDGLAKLKEANYPSVMRRSQDNLIDIAVRGGVDMLRNLGIKPSGLTTSNLIRSVLASPTELDNLVTQSNQLNRVAYALADRQMARTIKMSLESENRSDVYIQIGKGHLRGITNDQTLAQHTEDLIEGSSINQDRIRKNYKQGKR